MTRDEWRQIVGKLNASYPGQALAAESAAEFYDELAEYPAERVWRAVRRCRRERSFRPTLAELLDAMLANAREATARPSDHQAIEARDPDSPGAPAPASVKLMLRNLLNKRIPEAPGQPAGRSRDQQLADLEAAMTPDERAQAEGGGAP